MPREPDLRPLDSCGTSRAAVAALFAELQADNPLLRALGTSAADRLAYGEFLVARCWEWSVVAVAPDGSLAAMYLVGDPFELGLPPRERRGRSMEQAVAATGLPRSAAIHWGLCGAVWAEVLQRRALPAADVRRLLATVQSHVVRGRPRTHDAVLEAVSRTADRLRENLQQQEAKGERLFGLPRVAPWKPAYGVFGGVLPRWQGTGLFQRMTRDHASWLSTECGFTHLWGFTFNPAVIKGAPQVRGVGVLAEPIRLLAPLVFDAPTAAVSAAITAGYQLGVVPRRLRAFVYQSGQFRFGGRRPLIGHTARNIIVTDSEIETMQAFGQPPPAPEPAPRL